MWVVNFANFLLWVEQQVEPKLNPTSSADAHTNVEQVFKRNSLDHFCKKVVLSFPEKSFYELSPKAIKPWELADSFPTKASLCTKSKLVRTLLCSETAIFNMDRKITRSDKRTSLILSNKFTRIRYFQVVLTDFHGAFLLGDFNFRIVPQNFEEKTLFQNNCFIYDQLLSMDEVFANGIIAKTQASIRKLGLFEPIGDFIFESKINFPPTYKLIHKGFSYLLNANYVPCYPDRIFYLRPKNQEKKLTEQKSYESSFTTVDSDHKPVYAQFTVVKEMPCII